MTKKLLFRWCSWFYLANVALFWLIGHPYLHTVAWINTDYLRHFAKIVVRGFLFFSYVGQLALLAAIPMLLVIMGIALWPHRRRIFVAASLMMTCATSLLLVDTMVYGLFHYHLNGIVLNLVLHSANEQFFDFSLYEEILCWVVVIGLFLLELALAYGIWYSLIHAKRLIGWGKWAAIFIFLNIYLAVCMLTFSANHGLARIFIEVMRVLPLYTDFVGAVLPMKNGRLALERAYQANLVQPPQASQLLHYPLTPLRMGHVPHPLNVLVIVVDTWRFDMLNPRVMSNTYLFSRQATVYTNHHSGGNATGPGIFSLFYGLPASYWSAMEEQQRGPILLDVFLQKHYQTKMLASAGLTLPPFNKTVFRAIDHLTLKVAGKDPAARDVAITREFKKFIDNAQSTRQPFFSFLLYDAAHSYCAIAAKSGPFRPVIPVCDRLSLTNHSDPVPYLNRYKNGLWLVDKQIGEVLSYLKAHDLLEHTVIVITGDHGEEFNDNHMGYWGHASNFTRYQVQTPLMIYWPGKPPQVVSQATTHFDVPATLLEQVLHCQTPAQNYSIGHSLLKPVPHPYFLVNSYIGLGVVEKNRIITILSTGDFEVSKLNAEPVKEVDWHSLTLADAYADLRRFYRS